MSKTIDSIGKKIHLYMMNENRPYNATEIHSNMKDDTGKANFTRALDQLVIEKKVIEKTYGKQKIYYINQDLLAELDAEAKVNQIDNDIQAVSKEMDDLHDRIKKLEEMLSLLRKTPTNDEAKSEIILVKDRICDMKAGMGRIEEITSQMDLEKQKDAHSFRDKCQKEYTRRKRMANTVLDAILDGYPKGKKQLYEEIGIELDDGSNF